jgi:uncharacterized repeat protein (TIGR03803 family)
MYGTTVYGGDMNYGTVYSLQAGAQLPAARANEAPVPRRH